MTVLEWPDVQARGAAESSDQEEHDPWNDTNTPLQLKASHQHLTGHVTSPHKHASCANRNLLLACQQPICELRPCHVQRRSTNERAANTSRGLRTRVTWPSVREFLSRCSVLFGTSQGNLNVQNTNAAQGTLPCWNWAIELQLGSVIGPFLSRDLRSTP